MFCFLMFIMIGYIRRLSSYLLVSIWYKLGYYEILTGTSQDYFVMHTRNTRMSLFMWNASKNCGTKNKPGSGLKCRKIIYAGYAASEKNQS